MVWNANVTVFVPAGIVTRLVASDGVNVKALPGVAVPER